MSSRLIDVVVYVRISFLRPNDIQLHDITIFCLSIHLSIDTWSGFHPSLTVNNAATNIGVQIYVYVLAFNSFGCIPRSGTAEYLIFWGTAILLSMTGALFYILTNSAWGFQCLHIPTNTCYFSGFFHNSHPTVTC